MDEKTPLEIVGKKYATSLRAAEISTLYDVRDHEERPAGIGATPWALLKKAASSLGCSDLNLPKGAHATIHHSWYNLPVHIIARHPQDRCVAARVGELVARKDGDFLVIRYEHQGRPYASAMHPATLMLHDNVWHDNRAWSDDDEPATELPEARLPALEIFEDAQFTFPEAERARLDLMCGDISLAAASYDV
jgi:hypothetical protein